MISLPPTHEIESAYEACGLVPACCGPEVRRLSDGRVGGGPFVALYLQQIGVHTRRLNDDDLARAAELAEAWAIATYGAGRVAGFTAGFDGEGLVQFGGVAACSLPELMACHSGQWVRMQLSPLQLPSVAAAVEVHAC